MKKIIALWVLIVFSVGMVFTVAQEDSSKTNIDVVKRIEISDYYGMTSLLVNLHLELGRWVADEEWIFYVVDLLNQMKYYAGLDIIDYLWYSFDVEKSLDSVLFDISDMLQKSLSARVELEKNLTVLEQNRLACDEDKEVTDKNFSMALKDLDSKWMELNLDKSLEFANCALDARIYFNAQDKILDQLDFYYEVLEKKYSYFHGNRADIISHYPEILYNLSK